jgi:hypothetical protein
MLQSILIVAFLVYFIDAIFCQTSRLGKNKVRSYAKIQFLSSWVFFVVLFDVILGWS